MHISVFDISKDRQRSLLFATDVNASFRLGRQDGDDPNAVTLIDCDRDENGITRKLVVAEADERGYSRNMALVAVNEHGVQLHNTHSRHSIYLGSAAPLPPGAHRSVTLPVEMSFGSRVILLSQSKPSNNLPFNSLPAGGPPTLDSQVDASISIAQLTLDDRVDGDRLLELLQTMLTVLQGLPSQKDFYDRASQAMISLLEVDHVMIALKDSEVPLSIQPCRSPDVPGLAVLSLADTSQTSTSQSSWQPSHDVINAVEQELTTIYQSPGIGTDSLSDVASLVASPIKTFDNRFAGIVYVDRQSLGAHAKPFSQTEAKFVELFTGGIALALARQKQEREFSDMRTRFEQFFTPELATRLAQDPQMLEPRSAEVSILFVDIRGFSRISERIGPQQTINWMSNVMSELSRCVFDHRGVIVDYIGDEIMAMWGAPDPCDQHADLAVQAALAMTQRIPELNRVWAETIDEPIDIGIGINSGVAQVGNTGSEQKFKYGAMGDVVNVASRVQNATKQLRSRLLVTESTEARLPASVLRRELRKVRFVNVEKAVPLFDVPFDPDDRWMNLKNRYQEGLQLFSQCKLAEASRVLASLINEYPDDGPSFLLLADTVNALSRPSTETFDPVWQLTTK